MPIQIYLQFALPKPKLINIRTQLLKKKCKIDNFTYNTRFMYGEQ